MRTVCVPSTTLSSTARTTKVAEVSPAAITMLEGTVASLTSLDAMLMVMADAVDVLRVTTAVAPEPALSLKLRGRIDSDKFAALGVEVGRGVAVATGVAVGMDVAVGVGRVVAVGVGVGVTTSSSVTMIRAVPDVKLEAPAVIVTDCEPSTSSSFTALTENVALFCPASIVTLAGTVASLVSLENNVTTTNEVVEPARVTVPIAAGLSELSENEVGRTATVN